MIGNSLINVSDPINEQDVATKNYVDTISSDLDMNGNRILNLGRSVYETDAASLSDIHEKIAEETIFTKQLIDKKSLDVLTEARNLIKNYALLRNGTSKPHTNIDWNMKKIINLGDPDDLNDATTRGYVDNLITQKIRSETLLLDGPKKDINWNDKKITNLGNPINEQDAVNKNYVDRISQASTHLINEKALLVDGTNVPMNDINWNRKKITNLANPENASDAVNKHYVDHVQKKPIITIWAEENSGTTDGEYEWSFGNGGDGSDHGLQGYCMPASGRILRGTISAVSDTKPAGFMQVNVVKNRIEQTDDPIMKQSGAWGGVTIFPKPLELKMRDTINFISRSTNDDVTTATVALLIELDILPASTAKKGRKSSPGLTRLTSLDAFECNLFGEDDPALRSIQSGIKTTESVALDLSVALPDGKAQADILLDQRVFSKDFKLSDRVPKNKRLTFDNNKVAKSGNKAISQAQMESAGLAAVIELAEDGSLRHTAKSKLFEHLNLQPTADKPAIYSSLIDMSMLFRLATPTPADREKKKRDGSDYKWQDYIDNICFMVHSRHPDAEQTYAINDPYPKPNEYSIKDDERDRRSASHPNAGNKFPTLDEKFPGPKEFSSFMSNSQNKEESCATARAVKWRSQPKKNTMYLPPDDDSMHHHLVRVNYVTYCQKHYEVRSHPCPLGNGWALINGKCRPVRHSRPVLHSQENTDSDDSDSTGDTDSDTDSDTEEDTEYDESSESDLSEED
ncbi:hypothetical protein GQR58_006067 [Nymphon striatum]|nr:hypothetical protein GQR58_006067 [Nymphon striatum]